MGCGQPDGRDIRNGRRLLGRHRGGADTGRAVFDHYADWPTAVMAPWPSPSTGYNLQVNTHLATTNWVAPVESVIGRGQPKSKQHKETSRSQVLELKCAAAKIFCNRQPWLPYLRLYAKQDFFEFTCLELVCPCRLHN
jgi:hypothetical protein